MGAREAEFAEFFQARGPGLRRAAFLVVHDWQIAEDMTQQALAKVYAHWSRSDERRRLAFARKILMNECLTFLRRQRPEILVAQVADRPAGISDHDGEALETVRSLPPRQRAVVAVRIYEDLSVAEVAELLGISEGTVKSQTARALSKLKTQLSNDSSSGGK